MSPDTVTLRPANPRDLDAVLALLREAKLLTEGVAERFGPAYVVAATANGEIAGAAGVERYGPHGLIRSVVVAPAARGTGLGRRLTEDRLAWARAEGLKDLYLLTETAEAFWGVMGFARTDRAGAPAGVRDSHEWAHGCPASAVAMHRSL